jgi:hypothetical protein
MSRRIASALAFAAGLAVGVLGCTATPDERALGASVNSLEGGQRWRVLDVHYEPQSTGYWCGPTATRIALSARMSPPSQQALADQLHTTVNGTDSIDQVTAGLNANLGSAVYETKLLPHDPPTLDEKNRFWDDIVQSIDANYPVVANIVAPPSNHPPGYPSNRTIYHYFTIIGYNPDTGEAYIADPANFGGHSQYWLSFDQLATLVPPKGYSALPSGTRCAGGSGSARGAIGVRYRALGGCGSVLGVPKTDELRAPDGVGRYVVFDKGSIYWTQATGAHEVLGVIRDAYASTGWEAGALGYPVSGEYDVAGGRRSDFQHGSITWSRATNEATVAAGP